MNRRQFFALLPIAVVARKMIAAVKPKLIGIDWAIPGTDSTGYKPYGYQYMIFHRRLDEDVIKATIKPDAFHCIDGISSLQVVQKHFDHWGNA